MFTIDPGAHVDNEADGLDEVTLAEKFSQLDFGALQTTAADMESAYADESFQLDGGGYTSYGTFTTSPISFTAPSDGFYEFYTVGTDSVGNEEAAPDTADASTTVDTETSSTPDVPAPDMTRLFGARPNPFDISTSIRFDLHRPERVTLRVYDVRGRMIQTLIDRPMDAGRHTVAWDGKDSRGNTTSFGVYFVVLRALQGAGDFAIPMLLSLSNAFLVTIPLGFLLSERLAWGASGVAIAQFSGGVFVTLTTTAWLLTGRWTRGRAHSAPS